MAARIGTNGNDAILGTGCTDLPEHGTADLRGGFVSDLDPTPARPLI